MAKRKGKSPTELSLEWLRDQGYQIQKVEYWNSFAGARKDLFDVIDIVAVKSGEFGVLGVQCTDHTSVGSHLDKALESLKLEKWLLSGNRFEVHGWSKKKIKNKWHYDIRRERLRHPGVDVAALVQFVEATFGPQKVYWGLGDRIRNRRRATGCNSV